MEPRDRSTARARTHERRRPRTCGHIDVRHATDVPWQGAPIAPVRLRGSPNGEREVRGPVVVGSSCLPTPTVCIGHHATGGWQRLAAHTAGARSGAPCGSPPPYTDRRCRHEAPGAQPRVCGLVNRDALPRGRVVIAFRFPGERAGNRRFWLLVEGGDAEVCLTDPGDGAAAEVVARSPAFVDWHRGVLPWSEAVWSGAITVHGQRAIVWAVVAMLAPGRRRRHGRRTLSHRPARPAGPGRALSDGMPSDCREVQQQCAGGLRVFHHRGVSYAGQQLDAGVGHDLVVDSRR